MAKTTHKAHFGCTVEVHRGILRIRCRWRGKRYTRSTQLPDTAENRAQVEKLARLVAATIAADKDPLPLLEPKAQPAVRGGGLTVRGYFERWILDKKPPLVRRAQARDYRAHIERYVLPRLGDTPRSLTCAPRTSLASEVSCSAEGYRSSTSRTSCLRASVP